MSLQKYGEYRDSGVSWLGSVPAHWRVLRLKYACMVFPSNVDKHLRDDEPSVQLCNYTDVYYNEKITADMPFMVASASADQVAKFTLKAGDIVITKDSETADDIAIAAYVPEDLPGVVCGYHLSMIRPYPGTSGAFVKRLFDSVYAKARFAVAANGLTRVGLGQYALDNVELPFPPIDEQTAIAAFLDRKTAKIDALIAEQEKLIVLLDEKRRATISHAVTKGLNPDAPMRDSGVAWLGEVPAHWAIQRVKVLSRFTTSGPRGWSERITEDGSLFIQSGDLNDSMGLEFGTAKRVQVGEDAESTRTRLAEGDIVVCITGAKTGNVAFCKSLPEPAYVNQHLCLIRPTEEVDGHFLALTLKSIVGQTQFEISQYGLKQGLSLENVRELWVTHPPHDEQEAIVAYIEEEMRKLSSLAQTAEAGVCLLKERRSALIAAAVTGQIDVRSSETQSTFECTGAIAA